MNRQDHSFKEIFAWAWLGVFLLIALFSKAIFEGYGLSTAAQIQFEKPLYIALIVGAFVGLWVMLHMNNAKLERRHLAIAAAFAMPLLYFISSLWGASPYLSAMGIYTSFIAFIFFSAGILLVEYERIIVWLPKVILVFGYLIVVYGFLNLFGNVYLLDSLSMTPEDGVRISSIFQYANGYAVLLLVIWVGALIEIGRSRRIVTQVFHGAMLLPILVSFLLTLSRGAIVILPFVAIVTLLMFRFKQQLMVIIYSLIGMGISMAIYNQFTDRGEEVMNGINKALAAGQPIPTVSIFASGSISCWGILIGSTVVMALITWVIQKFLATKLRLNTGDSDRKMGLIIPLGLLALFIIGAIMVMSGTLVKYLPSMLRTRVEGINFQTHSVYERFTMYKDAIKIWKHHPIFGAGSGAWEAFYERYQSYSYTSNQTHSYIMQLLVETGIVGLLVHLAIIVVAIVAFVRFFRKAEEQHRSNLVFYFIAAMTVLLHSLIDFEMSYVLYGALVFMCLGIMTGTDRHDVLRISSKRGFKNVRYALAGILSILAVAAIIQAGRGLYVDNQVKLVTNEAAKKNASFQVVQSYFKKALSVEGNHPAVLQQLAAWYYQAYEQTNDTQYLTLADREVQRLNQVEPHYRTGIELTYFVAKSQGKNDKALQVMQNAIVTHPFTQSFYEQVALDLSTDWETKKASGDGSDAAIGQEIINNYEAMKQRDQTIKDLPKTVMVSRPFELSNIVRLSAAKVQFSNQQYADAAATLKPGLKGDLTNENDRNVALYYLASIRKQGEDDKALYERLNQADSSMSLKLEQLVESK